MNYHEKRFEIALNTKPNSRFSLPSTSREYIPPNLKYSRKANPILYSVFMEVFSELASFSESAHKET